MARLGMLDDCKLITTDGEVYAARVMIASVSEVLRCEFAYWACSCGAASKRSDFPFVIQACQVTYLSRSACSVISFVPTWRATLFVPGATM